MGLQAASKIECFPQQFYNVISITSETRKISNINCKDKNLAHQTPLFSQLHASKILASDSRKYIYIQDATGKKFQNHFLNNVHFTHPQETALYVKCTVRMT